MKERQKNPAFEHGNTAVWFADGAVALRYKRETATHVVYADPGKDLPETVRSIFSHEPGVVADLQTALDKSRESNTIPERHKALAGETIVKLSEMSPSTNR